MTFAIVSAVVLLIVVLWVVLTYNSMKKKNLAVGTARSDMAVQLQRRGELIPRLIETVKGAANYESSTLKEVVEKRQQMPAAPAANASTEDVKAYDRASQDVMDKLNIVVESYPEIKATQNFQELQKELGHTENMVAASRNAFNNHVLRYNSAISVFPNNMLAGMFKFKEESSFELTDKAFENAPEVKF